ncbi:hypothetical protein CBW65_17555 [Tumebacillus avium]|uniref:Uncharacterized protein n=1 Tax=Tumebacillus avium TaxID=1903704 RepID=A0A1Y0IRA9_9BACL|nr:hypothetical protein [Tumebacillus avium]ARU62569.1 hypothetical protein CBW65_17555 [Tumebacillus avium]
MAGKKAGAKKKTLVDTSQRQQQMAIVTVDTCLKCPAVCTRGAAYMEKMSKPGSIGYGVPCILRRK